MGGTVPQRPRIAGRQIWLQGRRYGAREAPRRTLAVGQLALIHEIHSNQNRAAAARSRELGTRASLMACEGTSGGPGREPNRCPTLRAIPRPNPSGALGPSPGRGHHPFAEKPPASKAAYPNCPSNLIFRCIPMSAQLPTRKSLFCNVNSFGVSFEGGWMERPRPPGVGGDG